MKKQFSKQEKQAYFAKLRERWQDSKKYAEQDDVIAAYNEALTQTETGRFSIYSFTFVLMQMRSQNLDGVPYLDMKTFQGWRDSGFMVKRGEHSTADGITWIPVRYGDNGKHVLTAEELAENEDFDYVMPKVYKLFHRSQVEELN